MSRSALLGIGLALGACGSAPPVVPGIPIARERVPLSIACAQRMLEGAGYTITDEGQRPYAVTGRLAVPKLPDLQELEIISFWVARSAADGTLQAQAGAISRDEHGQAAEHRSHYFVQRPAPREATERLALRILDECAR